MAIKPRILLSALPLALVLGACESPSGSGVINGGSSVSIPYGGAVTGSLAAQGAFIATAPPNTQTFAIGTRDGEGTLLVTAYRQRGGARFDVASITVPD